MAKSDDRSWLLNNSTDPESVTRYYDDWAERYDGELGDWDYLCTKSRDTRSCLPNWSMNEAGN